ncbi:hypothetical protein DOTSEDRAFT_67553 [Dothistroma septosporum NZE10]|uniref:Secreted protein n=1 Tax=Dothistroma septosporum (strain NZE10 / CBS 128990) TaxID=675120 RepID=N1PZX0_DOTSN|nr:hypothetical protein DOTSEDRAFT_67553 [Dothistroma septosporum NZE10]
MLLLKLSLITFSSNSAFTRLLTLFASATCAPLTHSSPTRAILDEIISSSPSTSILNPSCGNGCLNRAMVK